MPLLFDLETLNGEQADHLLDRLYKAISDPPDTEEIWTPHQDPWIRRLIEDWTDRGLSRFTLIRDHLVRVIDPEHPPGLKGPLRKAESWLRWDAKKMAEVQHALDSKARADYTLDDWLTLIDLLIQTYWPDGVIQSEADYLAIRAHFAGQLKANLETLPSAAQLKAAQIARIAALLPATFAHIPPEILTERDAHILRFAAAQTANLITNLTATTRTRMKTVILDGIKRITLGDRQGTWQKLGQELFDTFGDLNRDWRRIAITETGNATNTGYLSSLPIGTKVRREEAYRGACPFCQKIRGKILTVVSDEQEPKDWETEVWPSKSNVGRSASPRKRVGGMLIPRTPDELWSIPAGVVHPHCFISPNVPIYTSTGWQPIGDIRVGHQVLTHRGRFKTVNSILEQPLYTGEVFRFTVAFHGKNATPLSPMTPEHPVLTERGWIAAHDLRIGDALITLAKTCPTCRLAMNHENEYRFSTVHITAIHRRTVRRVKLYNFGVDDDESYIIQGGVVVHNCRGSWSRVASASPGMSNEYQMWLRGLLISAGLPASPKES